MITLLFKNGESFKTRCKTPASAINKAMQISPVKGGITGTALVKNGVIFGVIDGSGWFQL